LSRPPGDRFGRSGGFVLCLSAFFPAQMQPQSRAGSPLLPFIGSLSILPVSDNIFSL
jgi:hypothetical protein